MSELKLTVNFAGAEVRLKQQNSPVQVLYTAHLQTSSYVHYTYG